MHPQLIDGVGLWFDLRGEALFHDRPAVYLDRDGVIVEETHYLGRAEDVKMIPGAAEAIARANRSGIAVVVVTNQAGIGRGYYTWDGFAAVQGEIEQRLSLCGAYFDAVLACAYHMNALGDFAVPNHPWRKPNPGMIKVASDALGLDIRRSVIIGDKATDIQAGFRAGVGRGALVESGYGKSERGNLYLEEWRPMEIKVVRDIEEGIDWAI